MIIRSIEITNFLSYYDRNEFAFDAGATLIIGQNNTGKSKLFDAYNWVLYDEAYKTEEEEWIATGWWKDELVNRLAKKRCLINSKVEMSVRLTFEDDQVNRFVVTREYQIQKLSTGWSCPAYSELVVTKSDAGTYNSNNFIGEEASQVLNRHFPKNLSRYFLFQGEAISRLLRLNKRSDFTKAIGELSGIKYFEKAKKYAEKVYLRAKNEFESKEDSDAAVEEDKKKLVLQIDESKEKLSDLNNKLENEQKEWEVRQKKLDEKVEELSRFEECAKLLNEIRELEKQRDVQSDQRRKLFEYKRGDLLTTWMYGPVGSLFQNFLVLYRRGKEEKRIPEPIRQDFINEMLQDHICKVCGTPAPPGSPQHKHILGHVNEKALDQEVSTINTLSDTADGMKVKLSAVSLDIEAFMIELSQIQDEITRLRERIDFKEDELRVVTERIEEERKERIQRSELEKVNLTQLKKDRDQIKNDLDSSRTKVDQFLGRIEEADRRLKELEEQYQQLLDKSSNANERERVKLALEIRNQVHELHDNFLQKLINDIQEEANTYFENMTRQNFALSGKVRVDYDNQKVYTVDDNDTPITNINQANKVSLQIAFVAAVLSVSNKIWEKHFPFVADAPISALGGNNKISAVKTMIEIFRQSIIILKDDVDVERPETLKNDQIRQLIDINSNIHYAYELRMNAVTSVDEQKTEVIKLKG